MPPVSALHESYKKSLDIQKPASITDQSYEHTSINGCQFVNTPAFDRVAREGILFKNAFVSVPSCNPSRSSVLSGLPFYRLKEASMNHTKWPSEHISLYTDILSQQGYHVGYTGKGCAPTDWKAAGRKTNPAGPLYNEFRIEDGNGISDIDYARNFDQFLSKKNPNQPFCFWYGAIEPHRVFKKGIGRRLGKDPSNVKVPPYLPDTDEVRSDLLDYAVHIEWFDTHLGNMLKSLERSGELDNTLIIVTSDNGMSFPRAKATCYDSGTHMPLAIRWSKRIIPGRVVADFVSFTDFAPTILKAASVQVPEEMIGKSILPILLSNQSSQTPDEKEFVITGVERHFPGGRRSGLGYPIRSIRTKEYLYIKNYAPDRWPMGDPEGPVWPADDPTGGFGDCDGSPTKTVIWKNKKTDPDTYQRAFGKRPAEELYNVIEDPFQMENLAMKPEVKSVKEQLASRLEEELIRTKDPRATGKGEDLDQYAKEAQHSL